MEKATIQSNNMDIEEDFTTEIKIRFDYLNDDFNSSEDFEINEEESMRSVQNGLMSFEKHQYPFLDNKLFKGIEPLTQLSSLKKPCCKKNSLKFCRRISKELIDQLDYPKDNRPLAALLSFLEKALDNQLTLISGTILDSKEVKGIHFDLIKKVWVRNRGILSEKKNNKLSLVNFDEWERMFSFKGFSESLKRISNNFQVLLEKIEFTTEFEVGLFLGFYPRLLYILNVLILNHTIFVQMGERDVCQVIPELENFVIMTREPWLYRHYNHTKAKFALECCASCKICRSSLLPKDFGKRLEIGRERYRSLKALYEKHMLFSTEEDISAVFAFLAHDIWSQ